MPIFRSKKPPVVVKSGPSAAELAAEKAEKERVADIAAVSKIKQRAKRVGRAKLRRDSVLAGGSGLFVS